MFILIRVSPVVVYADHLRMVCSNLRHGDIFDGFDMDRGMKTEPIKAYVMGWGKWIG